MVMHIGGLADNGTVRPVGLPWIIPQIKCSFGGDIVVHPFSAAVSLGVQYETSLTLTLIHVQGYRAGVTMEEDNTTRITGNLTETHMQSYRAEVVL
jgi:hypothetical protein